MVTAASTGPRSDGQHPRVLRALRRCPSVPRQLGASTARCGGGRRHLARRALVRAARVPTLVRGCGTAMGRSDVPGPPRDAGGDHYRSVRGNPSLRLRAPGTRPRRSRRRGWGRRSPGDNDAVLVTNLERCQVSVTRFALTVFEFRTASGFLLSSANPPSPALSGRSRLTSRRALRGRPERRQGSHPAHRPRGLRPDALSSATAPSRAGHAGVPRARCGSPTGSRAKSPGRLWPLRILYDPPTDRRRVCHALIFTPCVAATASSG